MSGLKLEFPADITLKRLEEYGQYWATAQRLCNWCIGDIAREAESMSPDALHQVFPEDTSPGMVSRCKAVSLAYPNDDDRNPLCTWTQHMQVASKANRKELLEEIAQKGLTSDESRKALSGPSGARWLLAVDVNYHLHRHWYSGAGVEAAKQVCDWIGRLADRLKEKGLTDIVCCFDGKNNFRKKLTQDWDDNYKPRPPKEPELAQQIQLVKDLIHKSGTRCVSQEGFEADDLMASYAHQFDGPVTILTQDKDLRQCLGEKCNMLLDVEWTQDPTGDMSNDYVDLLPKYKWLSARQHTEATGVPPGQWADYQAIWGDNVDGIKGAPGIGEKGAKDLMAEFGTLDAVLEAARNDDERIKPKKREALLQLAERVDVVRQLVTLRKDLAIPMDTRITPGAK